MSSLNFYFMVRNRWLSKFAWNSWAPQGLFPKHLVSLGSVKGVESAFEPPPCSHFELPRLNRWFRALKNKKRWPPRTGLDGGDLEPQGQPFIYKWLFQLDDSQSLHRKWLFHQTSIYKWLFGVPGKSSNLFHSGKSRILEEKPNP